jgi:hypothetical protein
MKIKVAAFEIESAIWMNVEAGLYFRYKLPHEKPFS